jgi:hypothetical protein
MNKTGTWVARLPLLMSALLISLALMNNASAGPISSYDV